MTVPVWLVLNLTRTPSEDMGADRMHGYRTILTAFLCALSATFIPNGKGAAIWYVTTNGNDAADGFTWETAKASIQAAVDAASSNDTVLVGDGLFENSSRSQYPGDGKTNRVLVDKAIHLRSRNGPAFTTIRGKGPRAADAIRCVYLTNGASIAGFTLRDGATPLFVSGGGVACASMECLVSNCLITKCLSYCGGGVLGGRVIDCVISSNYAGGSGGGLARGQISFSDPLVPCRAENCLITGNRAAGGGGGATYCTLVNCTVVENRADIEGGGTGRGTNLNTIVYFNSAPTNENFNLCLLIQCTTTPMPTNGTGNTTNDPAFIDQTAGNYRLRATSPCVDAGSNAFVALNTDLDGIVRLYGTNVDQGAYEWMPLRDYWVWAAAITNGLTNLDACATFTGPPNLVRYALGGAPMEPLAREPQLLRGASGGPILDFHRNTNAVESRILLEVAQTLADSAAWTGVATNADGSWGGSDGIQETSGTNPVSVSWTPPPEAGTNLFLRLRVIAP